MGGIINLEVVDGEKIDFEAYCDASGIFFKKYQSIGTVSGSIEELTELRSCLTETIQKYKINEIKFKYLKSDNGRYKAAKEALNSVVKDYANRGRIRIDVLTWCTSDTRHNVLGRDDTENLGRLYYWLLRNIIYKWPIGNWRVMIDKDEKVEFKALKDSLNYDAQSNRGKFSAMVEPTCEEEQLLTIREVKEVESCKEPLIQMADLFAGMACFTHNKSDEFRKWLDIYDNPDQLRLPNFIENDDSINVTKTSECRYRMIRDLTKLCEKYRLDVQLSRGRLLTKNPRSHINFWLWDPQGDYDKAPKKLRWDYKSG